MARSRGKKEVPASIMGPRLLLMVCALALTLLGIVMVYSSSMVKGIVGTSSEAATTSWNYVYKQAIFACVGLVLLLIARNIPTRWWQGFSAVGRGGSTYLEGFVLWIVWGATMVLLVLTYVMGLSAGGATRWISIGGFSFQPSEFAKITLVLMTAHIVDDCRRSRLSLPLSLVKLIVVVGIPVLFLYKTQSDLGTTVIIAVGILAILWMGEVPASVIFGIVGLGVAFVLVAVFGTDYRSDRLSYLNPFSDHYDTTWQIDHSLWAFAEGGIFGVGLGNSRQKYLYLSESETDFIYAIIGEELGLIGAVAVIVLFMLFLYAGMRIARSACDDFGAMVAGSLTLMIVFQAFLNMGCVIGILPTTGKPLPFVSSGGSSLIATLTMVGLILSVSREAANPSVYERRRANLHIVRAADGGRSDGGRSEGRRSDGSGAARGRAYALAAAPGSSPAAFHTRR